MTAFRFLLPRLCCLALILAGSARAATTAELESFTLANGLEVIVIPNHRVPAVSHMLWYRVGGADDPLGKSGLAHYHEHMMYEGTARYPTGAYSELIARHGGQQNAFTGRDATAYYINISREELPLAMELEADRMNPISGRNADKEKEVIIEERRTRIENDPAALLSEQMAATLFRNHPYHWPLIGWVHEMKKLTRGDVMRFHERWYVPNNAILILSGDITAAEARPLAERYYGGFARGALPARRWNEEPPQNAQRHLTLRHPNVRQPFWSRVYATPSLSYGEKEQGLPLLVLSQLLGGGKTSRLYHSLVAEKKLASAVEVTYDAFTIGPSGFEISITPEADVSLEALEKAVDAELAAVLKEGFAPEDLTRAKTLLKAEAVYARDGMDGMARIMGWIRVAGLDKDYFLRWPELIEAVTEKEVLAAAKMSLLPEASVTGWLLPVEQGGGS